MNDETALDYLEIFGEERIQLRIAKLAKRIADDYQYCKLHLAIVLKDGFMFGSDLIRALPEKTRDGAQIGFVDPDLIMVKKFRDSDVLIVDGILESGETFDRLTQNLELGGASTVRAAALVWRKGLLRSGMNPCRYIGFERDGGAQLYGYGIGASPGHPDVRIRR